MKNSAVPPERTLSEPPDTVKDCALPPESTFSVPPDTSKFCALPPEEIFSVPPEKTGGASGLATTANDLGISLGVAVIAEGIETSEQLTLLRRFGCHEGQGFLFSRARPLCEIDFDVTHERQGIEDAA